MRGLLRQLLGGGGTRSAGDAKQRLKVLLVHDEVDLTPAQLDRMKTEIMEVIARYVDVEEDGVTFKLDKEEGVVALVSNVPVRRVTAVAS